MDLGPQPDPAVEPAEPSPGGPDAHPAERPTGVVRDLQASNTSIPLPDPLEGGLGVSSERVGHTGPGQLDTSGVKDTAPVPRDPMAPPEQSPGEAELNPVGLPPKAGYPSIDPRSDS